MIRHPTEKLILKSGFWMFLVKLLLVFSWFLRLIFSELNNIGTNWIFFSPLCTIPPNGNSNLVFLTSNLLQQWQHKLFDLTGNHFWSFWSLAARRQDYQEVLDIICKLHTKNVFEEDLKALNCALMRLNQFRVDEWLGASNWLFDWDLL